MKIPSIDGRYFWAALGGFLTTLAQPHVELTLLAWVGPAVLLAALYQGTPQKGWRLGACFGVTYHLSLLYWIAPTLHTYAPMPMPLALACLGLLAVYLAFYQALFGGLTAWLGHTPLRLLISAPILWVALEFAKARLLTGFPWGLLAYSQYKWLPMIQMAELTGPYGVSAVIMLVNGVVALWGCRMYPYTVVGKGALPSWQALGAMALATGGVVGGALLWGHLRLANVENQLRLAPTLNVAVVQGNIDQTLKWAPENRQATLDTYFLLSADLVGRNNSVPDLVVWPETAIPFYLTHDRSWRIKAQNGVRRMGTALLSGGPAAQEAPHDYLYFNSAFLLDSQGQITGRYDKRHLVPFGEYVPFKDLLFFIDKLVAATGDFSTGHGPGSLHHRGVAINTLICYEIIFPHLVRQHPDAGLIVNITNDAWFGASGGPYQHFSTAVFRAVENRRSVARAANTGISGFVLPNGKIQQATALRVATVEKTPLPVLTQPTFYQRYGDLFAWICSAMAMLSAVVRWYWQKMSASPAAA